MVLVCVLNVCVCVWWRGGVIVGDEGCVLLINAPTLHSFGSKSHRQLLERDTHKHTWVLTLTLKRLTYIEMSAQTKHTCWGLSLAGKCGFMYGICFAM